MRSETCAFERWGRGGLGVMESPRRDQETRWRVTFVDAVSARRIDVEVYAPDIRAARERGWTALQATRPPGLVVVELIEARPAEDLMGHEQPRENDHERDQDLHPPERDR